MVSCVSGGTNLSLPHQALTPGRVPHVRELSRTWVNTSFFECFHHRVYTCFQEKKKERLSPDFLWSLVALAHLMRLSLLKAAHAAVGECHVAGNPGRPSFSTHVRESPRTWGTRPGRKASWEAGKAADGWTANTRFVVLQQKQRCSSYNADLDSARLASVAFLGARV
jgi:hypothetical protein